MDWRLSVHAALVENRQWHLGGAGARGSVAERVESYSSLDARWGASGPGLEQGRASLPFDFLINSVVSLGRRSLFSRRCRCGLSALYERYATESESRDDRLFCRRTCLPCSCDVAHARQGLRKSLGIALIKVNLIRRNHATCFHRTTTYPRRAIPSAIRH